MGSRRRFTNEFNKREKAHRGIKSGFADYAFYIGDKIVFFFRFLG